MAPKRGIQQENTQSGSAKRPRLNPVAAVASKAIANPRRTKPRPEVYSPNIDTSDFSELTEDDDEPRNTSFARLDGTVDAPGEDLEGDPPASATTIPSGQSARETRASRRAAEKQGEDFTEDDEEELVLDVEAEIEEPEEADKEVEKTALGSDADAEGEVVEEKLEVQTPVVEDMGANADAEPDAEGEEVEEEPVAEVEEQVAEVEEAVADVEEPVEAIAKKAYALPAYYTTSDGSATPVGETPLPISSAEARYRAFMAERLAQSGLPSAIPHQEVSLFTPPGPTGLHAAGFYDPTSSSSSSLPSSSDSSSASDSLSDSSSVVEEVAPFPYAPTSSSTAFPALEELAMVDSRDSQETVSTTDMGLLNLADEEMDIPILAMGNDQEGDEGDGSYIVSRRNKLLDRFLSIQLRKIARALNFIIRAKATGIDVDDFDTLASVDPEKWSELVDTPEDAAEIMVEAMLQMSFWDIVILSKRATMLMDELDTLGITI
ncbi:hypothetical protein GGR51DRAFT_404061 [Nemania sp. FL0031]|nr:hypothetical protein GGR51DRAFT_404061 [Nemania sp. FL0031]